MTSHDSRRSKWASLLFVLAASLGANQNVVDAFGIAPPSATKSTRSTALDISTTIPHHQPSLVDRMWEEVAPRPQQQQPANKKKKKKTKQKTLDTSDSMPKALPLDDNNILQLDEQEVRKRKLEWAGRYATVDALRETFGANENKLWGDLQASTARRLYKTLLPRALLELSQLGVGELQPQELAPLAYQARVAAKLYARERCTVPARIAATLFDGFRQWLKYGKFQAHGMTYDQLWQKYSDKICHETECEEDVCLKILERSCVSNEGVDKLVLKETPQLERQQRIVVERIHAQLEQDMYELLLPEKTICSSSKSARQRQQQRTRRPWCKRNHVLMVRLLARQKRLLLQREKQQRQQQQQQAEEEVLRP